MFENLTSELKAGWKLKQKNVNALKRKNAIAPINKSITNFQDNWGKWLVFHNILEFYMVFTKCNSSITASIKLRQKSCRKKYSLLFTSPFLYSRINRASCNLPHRLRVKFFKYSKRFFSFEYYFKKTYFLLYKKVKLTCDWTGWNASFNSNFN